MKWAHLIWWKCGKVLFAWHLVDIVTWRRLPHITGAMIKLNATKLVMSGALIGCLGITGYEIPRLAGRIGDVDSGVPLARSPLVAAPEPGSLAVLIGTIGALIVIKSLRR